MDVRQRSPVTAAVTLVALDFLFVPLVLVVLFSFHETGGLSFPFTGFSLRWYRDTLGSFEFREALKNSAIVAVSVSVVTLVLGTLAAYGIRAPPLDSACPSASSSSCRSRCRGSSSG